MHHLKWIEIDLGAIRSNLRWTLSRLKRGAKLMAVVKAEAYGHGVVPIAKEAARCGASCLGVLTTAEAAVLRQAGIKTPIQLLSPIVPQDAPKVARHGLIATIDDLRQARALNAAAAGKKIEVHLDVDFGLGRWGIAPRLLTDILPALLRLPGLRLSGISTHIDYIPGKNSVEAEEKLRAFHRIAQRLKRRILDLVCHAANSSVLLDFPHWQMDQVRVGNLIYGINAAAQKSAELENPWCFKARIIALHNVIKGRSIGYASEYIAPRKMRVATLPVGYADGLTMEPAERLISFGAGFQYWGVIGETKAPFIGRCGISHVLVDVTDASQAKIGDVVTLPIRRTAASSQLTRIYL